MSEQLRESPHIVIANMGGLCPVQADGIIDGVPFYFRARGSSWAVEIGEGNTHMVVAGMDAARHNKSKDGSHETEAAAHDRIAALPVWSYGEEWGEEYEAGYMEHSVALGFIQECADKWRESRRPA